MIRYYNIVKDKLKCPVCGTWGKRHSKATRRIRDLGTPTEKGWLEVTTSKHYCPTCDKYFRNYHRNLYAPLARYTNRAVSVAISFVVDRGYSFEEAQDLLREKYSLFIPTSSIHDWIKREGYRLESKNE